MSVDGKIRWFSPDPRGIIPLDAFHVPKRLARVCRQGSSAWKSIVPLKRSCAPAPRERDPEDPGSWISDEIIESYVALHDRGSPTP
jgi:leucyl/phenylalanyl-tRNA--protein transferase